MAQQSVQKETGQGRQGSPVFCFPPPPVWLAPPADQSQSFEFFDITRPHFYIVNGVPMAFVSPEVRP